MKKNNSLKVIMAFVIIFTLAACNKNVDKNSMQPEQPKISLKDMMLENGANPDESAITAESADNAAINDGTETANRSFGGHFLYTESNAKENNQVMVFKILRNGSLYLNGTTTSGGAGMGTGLGSQGALVLDKEHEWLFAVNAGSNSVSSFKVHNDGSLTLAHTESSWGTTPVSVTVHRNLLYVLNFGSDNIHGFRIGEGGTLSHIDGSTQPLSGKGVVAPQISFTPDGDRLIVTEKATNNITSFKVKYNGSVWPAVVTASTGQTPFGFDFARDKFMVVSNAAGGAPGAGSATSYFIGGNAGPRSVNGAIANNQAAPCWVAVSQHGRFAYVTNTGSNSISSYYIGEWGGLYLVHEAAATTGNSPTDIIVAKNNYFVYALTAKSNSIGQYRRSFFGGLESIGTISGLPASADGLAIY